VLSFRQPSVAVGCTVVEIVVDLDIVIDHIEIGVVDSVNLRRETGEIAFQALHVAVRFWGVCVLYLFVCAPVGILRLCCMGLFLDLIR
jgi:hypothetical protein